MGISLGMKWEMLLEFALVGSWADQQYGHDGIT